MQEPQPALPPQPVLPAAGAPIPPGLNGGIDADYRAGGRGRRERLRRSMRAPAGCADRPWVARRRTSCHRRSGTPRSPSHPAVARSAVRSPNSSARDFRRHVPVVKKADEELPAPDDSLRRRPRPVKAAGRVACPGLASLPRVGMPAQGRYACAGQGQAPVRGCGPLTPPGRPARWAATGPTRQGARAPTSRARRARGADSFAAPRRAAPSSPCAGRPSQSGGR